ncbi:MAG TPA: FHA domain-containing protein [Vicinamibacteria bacterium]|jgi:DNA-binding winged helix-turn-helix (wHTH) protein|nr:FHA domain-containing protein [Vicinamibacteria bacterium]
MTVAIRFGDCTIDIETRRVMRCGEPVHLSPLAFELVEILVAARPRVVPKAELMKRLWPTTSVVEANLANLVAEIRAALGESPSESPFVRTVHGFGYAFSAEVTSEGPTADAAPFCWLVYKEGRVALQEGDHLVGRHPTSVVPIDSSTVSRNHARIVILGGRAVLTDLGSRNGTYVRGVRVEGPVTLRDGDSIFLGSLPLTFRVPDPTDEMFSPG